MSDPNKDAFLKSSLFKEILEEVRVQHHPSRTLLPLGATMEQRAQHQIRSEEFERLVSILGNLSTETAIKSVESTYGVQEPQLIQNHAR